MPSPAKVQSISAADAQPATAVIDRFCELDSQVKGFAPIKSEHESLRKRILEGLPDLAGDASVTLAGERYELLIGLAQEQQKIVSMPAVYRRLKVARFIALCQMTIKALTGELGETEAAKYLKRERTGPRSLTPIPKYHEAA
jgi:hypothetical protein